MSSEWKEVHLQDLVTLKRGYDLPKANRLNGIFPILASNGITGFHNEFKVKGPGIVTGRSGTLGEVMFINKDFWPLNTTLYGKQFHGNDIKFVYYFLKTLKLHNYNSGSSVPTLNRNHIHSLLVKIPSKPEQYKIGCVLSSLDDKIELNNAINKNLEEMAQALFKRWFIDFEFPNENGEPYKSSGGEFEESELGLIPKGWNVGVFQDLVIDVFGGDWGKETSQGNYTEEVTCIRGADIPEIVKGNTGKVVERYILKKNLEKKKLCAGDTIIEISGGSPTQSTGRTVLISNEVLSKFSTEVIATNFCKVIRPNKKYSEFLFCYLSYFYMEDYMYQFENGTTGIKNLDMGSLFSTHKISIPSSAIINKFAEIFNALYIKIQTTGNESNNIGLIRDSLLPRLMSGEIRVPMDEQEQVTNN
ncbi:restriction endonuclease subunit S [Paenibacillus sp. MER 99-2]|uniref:restriction endonuclease subunit S n=1 Tax=Paenibacillus sp. MER 99-2 TaxID=2939572 RepID=UPI002040FB43|nr:restriction endonuclease subunit S [Paenibacillus sp. MER 99-2]MCM3170865.1 restriction endonuclease subunit S [Paenibacillus sp. MER 99-2]